MLRIKGKNYHVLHLVLLVRLLDINQLKLPLLKNQEEIYYEIIRQKTAMLLAACCAMGAKSVDANDDQVAKMHEFGELLGMAFQIKDDLFDYSEQKIGKPTGIDIKDQKMTLPMIHALNVMGRSDKNWLINTVKNHNKDKKRVREAIKRIKEVGGLEFAEEKMESFRVRALEKLKTFPKNIYRDSLELMVNYVIERSI